MICSVFNNFSMKGGNLFINFHLLDSEQNEETSIGYTMMFNFFSSYNFSTETCFDR